VHMLLKSHVQQSTVVFQHSDADFNVSVSACMCVCMDCRMDSVLQLASDAPVSYSRGTQFIYQL
jgi:hypothetical protein